MVDVLFSLNFRYGTEDFYAFVEERVGPAAGGQV